MANGHHAADELMEKQLPLYSSDWSESEFLRNESQSIEESRTYQPFDKSASFYAHGFEDFLQEENAANQRMSQSCFNEGFRVRPLSTQKSPISVPRQRPAVPIASRGGSTAAATSTESRLIGRPTAAPGGHRPAKVRLPPARRGLREPQRDDSQRNIHIGRARIPSAVQLRALRSAAESFDHGTIQSAIESGTTASRAGKYRRRQSANQRR